MKQIIFYVILLFYSLFAIGQNTESVKSNTCNEIVLRKPQLVDSLNIKIASCDNNFKDIKINITTGEIKFQSKFLTVALQTKDIVYILVGNSNTGVFTELFGKDIVTYTDTTDSKTYGKFSFKLKNVDDANNLAALLFAFIKEYSASPKEVIFNPNYTESYVPAYKLLQD